MSERIVIVGAGPTGIGAAFRLNELGYENWAIYERNNYVGGHSSSHFDEKGFLWDEGGHVIFSHYHYFDHFLDRMLGKNFIEHERQSWVRVQGTWVPYPFQNNIRYLPKEALIDCFMGLVEANKKGEAAHAVNFAEWTSSMFGSGIARYFMSPYNSKVWAFPLNQMDKHWIAERVSTIDIHRVFQNIIFETDDVGWGPNSKFKFPLYGGTGEIYRQAALLFQPKLKYGKQLSGVNLDRKQIEFSDGTGDKFDALISTIPLDLFVNLIKPIQSKLVENAAQLVHNGIFVVGIGLEKRIDTKWCWLYFPEDNCPFYRVTYFHNYSPNNVPGGQVDRFSSLMCETSYSLHKPVSREAVREETINGLIASGMMLPEDVDRIVSTFLIDSPYAYPVPSLGRDEALSAIQPDLMANRIFSRGRFGAWRYEIGNMDHSVMQGVEAVNNIIAGDIESVWSSA